MPSAPSPLPIAGLEHKTQEMNDLRRALAELNNHPSRNKMTSHGVSSTTPGNLEDRDPEGGGCRNGTQGCCATPALLVCAQGSRDKHSAVRTCFCFLDASTESSIHQSPCRLVMMTYSLPNITNHDYFGSQGMLQRRQHAQPFPLTRPIAPFPDSHPHPERVRQHLPRDIPPR